jgi:type IV secretory pathway VirB10-like protein
MSDPHLEPLPEELQELLRNTPRPAPPPGFEERLRTRLERTVAEGGPGHASGGAAAKLGTWGVPLAVAALAVGAAGGYLAGLSRARGEPAPEPTVVARAPEPSPAPPAPEVEPEAPVAPIPPPAPEPPRAPVRRPAPVERPPPPAPAPAPSRDVAFAEERALIELARTSLARGEHQRALASLQAHARTFPQGQLAEEREVLWINALIALRQPAVARQKASEFRQRFPKSMLLPAVDAAVESLDAPGED